MSWVSILIPPSSSLTSRWQPSTLPTFLRDWSHSYFDQTHVTGSFRCVQLLPAANGTVQLIRMHRIIRSTQEVLKKTQLEMKMMCKEKDDEITKYRLKIDSMGTQYESVLMDSLDRLVDKLDTMRDQWKETTLNIQDHNKEKLLEFGLNPLEF
ncbi:hypothetical protein LSAT2_018084 [Lamellibrachia satsuma]|nr:hypothetical protein LSAT2_018084 [Lamellibrachia satsuma]